MEIAIIAFIIAFVVSVAVAAFLKNLQNKRKGRGYESNPMDITPDL